MKKLRNRLLYVFAGLGILYLLLLIPDSKEKNFTVDTGKRPFAWNRDSLWLQMEEQYRLAKEMDTVKLDSLINVYKMIAEAAFIQLQNKNIPAHDSAWAKIETINMYGASAKPGNKHFADQVEMYLKQQTKTITLDKATVYKNAERVYHPE